NENFAPVELIVVTRGGGSMEDLWEFNEEIVARTIADVTVPIVSAIGHEIDFTIADFVADLRAPTPSAAAELIVPDIVDLRRRLVELPKRAMENARHRFRRSEGILRVLGPDATLRRGYSITRNEHGELIRSVTAVRAKMKIRTRVSDGEFGSTAN